MTWLNSLALAVVLLFGATASVLADTTVVTQSGSEDVEAESGDATASNSGSSFTGHHKGGDIDVSNADVENSSATNIQEGDNEFDVEQQSSAQTGDAVAGQVIGAVSSGDLTINATNISEDVDATTGDATATNSVSAFVGLLVSSDTDVSSADISNAVARNLQEGDNGAAVVARQDASSGDAVTGQVLGAVTDRGGDADVAVANTSKDTDSTSGESDSDGESALFVGVAISEFTTILND